MTGFFVRTAGERDLAEISRLLAETWHATYDPIYGVERVAEITASWHAIAPLKQRVMRPNSEFLVADDGSRLAAMAFAAAAPASQVVLLHQIYVLPAFQGQGIGRDMLHEVEGCFPDADILRVEVEEANTSALRFYDRNGFLASVRTSVTAGDAAPLAAIVLDKPIG